MLYVCEASAAEKVQQASAAILSFFRCALSVPLGKNPIVIKTPQHAAETLYFLEKKCALASCVQVLMTCIRNTHTKEMMMMETLGALMICSALLMMKREFNVGGVQEREKASLQPPSLLSLSLTLGSHPAVCICMYVHKKQTLK